MQRKSAKEEDDGITEEVRSHYFGARNGLRIMKVVLGESYRLWSVAESKVYPAKELLPIDCAFARMAW